MGPRKDVRRFLTDERGITGLETAIILIAFVVVAAVFAFVVLGTGQFAADRSRETVFGGLEKTRGSMTLAGSMIATSNGTEVTDISFSVTLAAGGSSVNWDPDATSNKTIVSYIDGAVTVSDFDYAPDVVTGDGDFLLEPGELFEITLTGIDGDVDINKGDVFTLQVQPVSGAVLTIQRTMPASIAETIVNLN
jgi:flagellin FlaB